MKYANAKMALQILSLRDGGPPISLKIQQDIGVNDRTKKIITLDTSEPQVGRQSLQNRLQCLLEIKFELKR